MILEITQSAVRYSLVHIGTSYNYLALSSEEALRSIRRKKADRIIWVDFLCINQEDIGEKTRQVGLMREILTQASRTLMYLGHASADTDMALDIIESTSSASST